MKFIVLKGKESDGEAGIFFSWRDTDKIQPFCVCRATQNGWILEDEGSK